MTPLRARAGRRPGPRRHVTSPLPMCLLGVLAVRVPAAETAPAGQRPRSGSPPAPRRGSEYAQLSRQIKEAGLLQRRPGYYARKIAVTAGLLAAGWAVFVVAGDSWWQLAVAAFLAVVFTQIGFLGHDAGHRQIFGSRRANYLVGLVHGNLAI